MSLMSMLSSMSSHRHRIGPVCYLTPLHLCPFLTSPFPFDVHIAIGYTFLCTLRKRRRFGRVCGHDLSLMNLMYCNEGYETVSNSGVRYKMYCDLEKKNTFLSCDMMKMAPDKELELMRGEIWSKVAEGSQADPGLMT